MSLENRIRDINRAYVQRSLITGGNRCIGSGMSGGADMEIRDILPSKKLGTAVGGKMTKSEYNKRYRANLKAKKEGSLVSNDSVEPKESNVELTIGEVPEDKKTSKQVYKNKQNKRIEVTQTIDVKAMDDKPRKYEKGINVGSGKPKASKWIDYVKAFASKNNVSYKDALSNQKCKEGYRKMK